MQSKWRAPACYVGVGILCALYLSIVPGVSFTDVCAGAGLGAAVMWAINEWETGKWNVSLPVQPALAAILPQPAALAVAGDAGQMQALALQAAQAAAQVSAMPAGLMAAPLPEAAAIQPAAGATPAAVHVEMQQELPEPTPRHRVDSGAPTPEKMEKWEIDEKEPSWDATALAETWAKLRAELSINRPGNRQTPAVSPDLPRGSQYARNADGKGSRPQALPSSGGYGRPAAASPAAVKFPAAKGAPAKTTNVSIPGRQPAAKPYAGAAPAKPQPVAAKPATATPAGYTLGSLGQNGGSPVLASLASGGTKAARPSDKPAEPARQIGSFLRAGAFRPR
ncbi:hypothetical protein MWN33_12750 [Starkeya koreensis]|uniref:Uncharacterized protein n=1 Tax=Ancylobacter koreensis TaxID=266121 RepID=A0ABT0DNQ4_9HYPH|nr:hypothetical protein [Ancylobacter koreensis]MCK0208900.1 hypothetical protein [Ancylobacter koreensis]